MIVLINIFKKFDDPSPEAHHPQPSPAVRAQRLNGQEPSPTPAPGEPGAALMLAMRNPPEANDEPQGPVLRAVSAVVEVMGSSG